MSSEEFREAFSRVASSVSIVSTDGAHGIAGFTCSAVCSVTDDPPTIMVCVNRKSAANAVIKHNPARHEKTLWTRRADGPAVRLAVLADAEAEARFVANEMQALRVKPGDCAVLYRSNVQSRAFEDALREGGIPYEVTSGNEFYERKEVKDMLAYLRLTFNPFDNVSVRRIINVPTRGIGGGGLEKIEAVNDRMRCFITVAAEEVINGNGLLNGLPVSVKDLYDTKGIRTTAGSKIFENRVPNEDAVAVRKLKEAGAVIVGKTNLHEFAYGVTNINPHYVKGSGFEQLYTNLTLGVMGGALTCEYPDPNGTAWPADRSEAKARTSS